MSKNDRSPLECPECSRMIVRDDVNVANDVAYCRSCNLAHRLSELVHDSELTDGVDFARPPAGLTYSKGGAGMVVAATHRSLGSAFGALAFALFWNGIVSVFVLVAIAGTLLNLNIPIPSWFPAPEMNGSPMSSGMTFFLWIFLTPFIVIGLSMVGAFVMYIGGRTEVRIDHQNGTVFTGIGPLGYRRHFMASTVSDVRVDDSHRHRRQKTSICIETREGKIIRFGTMLSGERRRFLAASLRKVLVG